jgi:hypothetical protein
MIFLTSGLLVSVLVLWESLRKTLSTAQWPHEPDQFFLLLLAGIIGGVILFVSGFRVYRRKRLIESIPTSPIRSLTIGLVEVFGKAASDRVRLVSPFSGTPCVFFSYTVQERRGSGKDARWETIAKGTSAEPFLVRDDTAAVLVVPLDADLMVAEERMYTSEWPSLLQAETEIGLSRIGIMAERLTGGAQFRCSEALILQNEPVYVLGTAQINPAAADHADNAERLYIGSHRDEWFIISDRSEKELLAQLGWRVIARLYGGPALAAACLLLVLGLYVTATP